MEQHHHANTDGTKSASSSSSSSISSYPPSLAANQPAWLRPNGRAPSQSLRQRVFDLFESKHSTPPTTSRGTTGQPWSEADNNMPKGILASLQDLFRHRLCKRFIIIACVLYGLTLSYSFSRSRDVGVGGFGSQVASQPSLQLADTCPRIFSDPQVAIKCHVELAQRKFDAMVARQSQTYEQAVQRYVEQYNRQPPPGFQDWFTFAKANNAIIIDDYGQLEQDLAPLRKIPAHVLRQRMKNGRKTGMWELHQWDFKNGTVSTGAKHGTVNAFKGILQPFVHKLPDFSVLQNWDDNHRVCGPKPGEVEDVNDTTVIEVGTSGDPDAMDHLTIGCPRNTETTSSVTSDRPSVDFCKHTHDWMNQHGIFRVHNGCFNSTVPVLSLTKISSFQDITTASWCYGADGYRLWGLNPSGKDSDHVAYRDKRARIYWRGSNTGSRRGKKPHYYGHRERLVMMGAQMQKKAAELAARYKGQSLPGTFTQDDVKRVELPEMPKTFTQLQLSALSRLDPEAIDMNFVGLHGCQNDPERCAEWEKTFPLAAHQDSSFAFRNKFLMDIDGNSMSCRFYRLLDSNSLVFKQTIYVEWHDDRIVPWLHYVPVSKGMEELPILLDYFTNDPTGQALGEMIANTSRDWSNSALRKIDLSVYTYRQMLELAHIIGHD